MNEKCTEVINEIKAHIKKQGGAMSSWYVGITADIDERLHGDHKVPKEDHWFIHKDAGSETNARAVEAWFMDNTNVAGDKGGGINPTHVYAYLITSITEP